MRFEHKAAAGLLQHVWLTGCNPEGMTSHAGARTACIASSAAVVAVADMLLDTSVDLRLWVELQMAQSRGRQCCTGCFDKHSDSDP